MKSIEMFKMIIELFPDSEDGTAREMLDELKI